MHWTAFDARPALGSQLVGEAPVSLLYHAGRVFVGHQAGSLSVYDVPASGSDASLAHFSKSFAKKAIEQLGVIKETNSLVSLSDGNITLSDLQTFAVQTVLPQTKGQASSFAIDTSVQALPSNAQSGNAPRGSPGVPTLCTHLAVACKRRLIVYRWKDSEWMEPFELNLPHQARSLAFPTPTTLILGYSTSSYGAVALPLVSKASATPVLSDLQVPTPAAAAATLQPVAGASAGGLTLGLDRLGGLAMRTTNYMGIGGMGRVARNDVLTIGDAETLVVRDAIGVLITQDGKLSRSKVSALEFPAPPDSVVFSPPYVVSLYAPGSIAAHSTSTGRNTPIAHHPLSATICVHSTSDSLSSVQSFLVPTPVEKIDQPSLDYRAPDQPHSVRLLTASPASSSASGGRTQPLLLLSSAHAGAKETDTTIWLLSMRTWDAQLADMEARGEYAEALSLLGDGKANVVLVDKAQRRARLQQLEAVADLFVAQKAYDRAIDVFIEHQTTPAKVVSLYPVSIAGRLVQEQESREAVFGGRKAQNFADNEASCEARAGPKTPLKAVSGSPARRPGASIGEEDSERGSIRSASLSRKKSNLKQSSLDKQDTPSPPGSVASATPAEEHSQQIDFRRSLEALVRYLTDRRQQVNKALSALRPGNRPSPAIPLDPLPSADELFKLPDVPMTSLTPYQLHCVAQVVDTALFKCYLATRPGLLGPLCRLDNWCEIEEIEGLLYSAKRYRELLDLYNGKNSHEKAITLLKRMSEDALEPADKVEPTVTYLQKLGSKHLDLIFDASSWVFEVDKLAGLQIFVADLEEVESLPRHAVMRHLARIGPDVCEAYLEHIIKTLGEEGPEFHEKLIELYMVDSRNTDLASDEHDKAYRKLIDFLESSTQYRADRLLGRLPSDSMYEVRAVLLGRLGQHEGALQIYVHRLKDFATAEECCARIYDSAPDDRGSIYLSLLRIYLRPKDEGSKALFEPALDVLARHGARIDISAVLELLPPLVPVQDLSSFLFKALRRATEMRRHARIEREVYRARTDNLDLALIELEERRVKITDSRLCPVCHKRLGNSVIAVMQPDGAALHYACVQR